MRSFLACLMFSLLLLAPPAGAQEEAPASTQEQAPADEAQSDEEIMETVPVEEGTDSEPPPEDEELSTTYSSIGLNKISTNFDNVDDAVNLDITLIGFRIPTVPWFGVELNLGFTMIPGQITETTPGSSGSVIGCGPLGLDPCPATGSSTTSSGDFGVNTVGAFGVFRSTGTFFAMGKVGYRYLSTNLPELQENRSGSAWGAGVGYRWNKKGSYAELGYLKLSDDVKALGFAVSYSYERR
ncbi:MAG: hypothetical protein HYZ32_03410 [Hydrocarboniphaga effusa]|nr:hypothetical protein [Hydrocarboniphaga effusa]